MTRKRLTQIFPWLLPIRQKQKTLFFYAGMALDRNKYAKEFQQEPLKYCIYESSTPLYNTETGFDMVYQHNKVFNLKLASKKVSKLVIHPNETFSFWKSVKDADKEVPYKEGLVVVDDKLTTVKGGGLCLLSNHLFWMFLHTPLTIVERHTHKIKDFPNSQSGTPDGVDATVAQGWLDLKVRNDTHASFQIELIITEDELIGRIYSDVAQPYLVTIKAENEQYIQKGQKIFERLDILKQYRTEDGRILKEEFCYENQCEIGYKLPDTVLIRKE